MAAVTLRSSCRHFRQQILLRITRFDHGLLKSLHVGRIVIPAKL